MNAKETLRRMRMRGPTLLLSVIVAIVALNLAPTVQAKKVAYEGPDGKWRIIDDSEWPTAGDPRVKAGAQRVPNTTINFTVTYMDVVNDTNVGFDDPNTGAARRNTVNQVLQYIDSVLNETGACQIEFQNSEMDGSGALGKGGPYFAVGQSTFTESFALIHIQTGNDPSGSVPDIQSTFDFGWSWHEGTSQVPSGQLDLYSVLLHELTHGLGIITLTMEDGQSQLASQGYKVFTTWDNLLYTGNGTKLWNSNGNLNGSASILTGGDGGVYFHGSRATTSYGSNPPIYAPSPFKSGSSIGHWDVSATGPPVMRHSIMVGTMVRTYQNYEKSALVDLDYNISTGPVPTPTPTRTAYPSATPTPTRPVTPTPTGTPGPPTATPTRTPSSGGEEPIRTLIRSFYQGILGRQPEAGAVDAWHHGYFDYAVNFNIDVRFIPREMARIFFLSDEYKNRNRTNEQFIRDNYNVFLNRQPSQEELNGWLSGQWNRPRVMTLFAESEEFAQRIQGMYPNLDGDPVRNFVTTMYIGLLDRLVDKDGLEYFAQEFNQTNDVRERAKQMARDVVNSPEFQNKGPTAQDYVNRLYRAFLGRFPGDDEVSYWVGELNAGRVTVNNMIDQFANSPEFADIQARYFKTDLTLHQPSGWGDMLVVSARTGTNTDEAIQVGQPAYFDYSVINQGSSDTRSDGFYVNLWDQTSGRAIRRGHYQSSLWAHYYYRQEDVAFTFNQRGWHEIHIYVDADNDIDESNEGNNHFTKNVYVD